MAYLLQVDFPHDGIFGEEFSKAFVDLANDIASEDGLLWKIWTEREQALTAEKSLRSTPVNFFI